jgi:hypothetical protein
MLDNFIDPFSPRWRVEAPAYCEALILYKFIPSLTEDACGRNGGRSYLEKDKILDLKKISTGWVRRQILREASLSEQTDLDALEVGLMLECAGYKIRPKLFWTILSYVFRR